MQIHFLKAAGNEPLTKTFTKQADGSIQKTSYPPQLFKVSSKAIEVTDTESFFQALKIASGEGFALQKGELDSTLVEESRANHTLKDKPTEWVLFDVDGLESITSIDRFIKTVLPKAFHDVTYIVQYSASYGIFDDTLNAHLFFLMEGQVAPKQLKNWLRLLNLQNPVLQAELALQNGNKSALKWPLDVSVAGNDKYVYIAPPVCVGFDDPVASRIQIVRKGNDRVNFSFSGIPDRPQIRRLENSKVKELRDKEHLPQLSLKTTKSGEFDILVEADPLDSYEIINETDHFFHLNINGGDSGAYWISKRRPKFLHSFKDEPSRIIKQISPELRADIKDKCSTQDMLVFRDVNTDKFFVGKYDPNEDEYESLDQISRGNISDWCEDIFNASPPDPIPQYRLIFDPTQNVVFNRNERIVNMFQKSEYMKLPPDPNATIPATIDKVIRHVMNYDDDMIAWFLNWFAYIFQYRRKTMVAPVLHGTKGTGKGTLFHHIIKPLLGDKVAQLIQQKDIVKDQFNEFLSCLFVMLDESEADPAFRSKLFSWITEPSLRLRLAYSHGRAMDNYTNFMLCSNQPDAAPIEENDRRFTVAQKQMKKLELTQEEVLEVIPSELSQFARFLLAYEVDTQAAIRPLETDAKNIMREDTLDSIGVFIQAVSTGDICYFLSLFDAASASDKTMESENAIKRWAVNVNNGKPTPVSIAELNVVYRFTSSNQMPVSKFLVMLSKRGLPRPKDVIVNGKATQGIEVEWRASAAKLKAYKDIIGGVRAEVVDSDIERAVVKIGDRNGAH